MVTYDPNDPDYDPQVAYDELVRTHKRNAYSEDESLALETAAKLLKARREAAQAGGSGGE